MGNKPERLRSAASLSGVDNALARKFATPTSHDTPVAPRSDLASSDRRHYVALLSTQIWADLGSIVFPTAHFDRPSISILSDIAHTITVVSLVAKSCDVPQDLRGMRRVRDVCSWAATQAVDILAKSATELEQEGVDRLLLEKSVCYLAARECFGAQLCRNVSLGLPSDHITSFLPTWWQTMDRLYCHFDDLTSLISSDPRYVTSDGAKQLLRSIFTAEQYTITVQTITHMTLER
ncbi:hypothetical protein MNV49_006078 [Pseudohyphozyma bogoriensis]|nr:hypothetical protein MNV49_006078 [Pseudohyphozyma bogoriensis]